MPILFDLSGWIGIEKSFKSKAARIKCEEEPCGRQGIWQDYWLTNGKIWLFFIWLG
jgi:hypothetical protein